MKIDLSGRRALVTGSTAGIGFGIAAGLAGAGAVVLVNGRSQASVDGAVERLRAAHPGAEVEGIVADLGTAEGCEALLAACGDIDVLVNNVGIFDPKPFAEIPDADWQRFFDVNVMSGVRVTRGLIPGMMARGWGRVIFISSESGLQIPVEMIHYGMTKTAQLAVSRGLAEMATGTGVTVNAVLPGPTRSDGVVGFLAKMAADSGQDAATLEADFIRQHRPTSLIGRLAEVEEVANMVVYLASPQASATTGAAVRVDGGVVRSIA